MRLAPFLICLALLGTHGLAWLWGWLVGDARAADRVNRQWIKKDEWERITRVGGSAAWLKKEDSK